jgi:AcrR family transcriptional regulator
MNYFCYMSIKEKIINTALVLFNQHGIDKITTRHIAKEMGISHGNLCYHYLKKEDIIIRLYQNLVAELDIAITSLHQEEAGLAVLFETTRITFGIQYKYKFFLLDMVSIMRHIEPIRTHFRALFVSRKGQFSFIIHHLIQKGFLRNEIAAGQYERFIAQFYIIGDFWIAEAEILFEGTEEDKLQYYTNIACSALLPYFTEAGLQEVKRLRLWM